MDQAAPPPRRCSARAPFGAPESQGKRAGHGWAGTTGLGTDVEWHQWEHTAHARPSRVTGTKHPDCGPDGQRTPGAPSCRLGLRGRLPRTALGSVTSRDTGKPPMVRPWVCGSSAPTGTGASGQNRAEGSQKGNRGPKRPHHGWPHSRTSHTSVSRSPRPPLTGTGKLQPRETYSAPRRRPVSSRFAGSHLRAQRNELPKRSRPETRRARPSCFPGAGLGELTGRGQPRGGASTGRGHPREDREAAGIGNGVSPAGKQGPGKLPSHRGHRPQGPWALRDAADHCHQGTSRAAFHARQGVSGKEVGVPVLQVTSSLGQVGTGGHRGAAVTRKYPAFQGLEKVVTVSPALAFSLGPYVRGAALNRTEWRALEVELAFAREDSGGGVLPLGETGTQALPGGAPLGEKDPCPMTLCPVTRASSSVTDSSPT